MSHLKPVTVYECDKGGQLFLQVSTRLPSSVSPTSPAALENPPYGPLTWRPLVPAQLPDGRRRSDRGGGGSVCSSWFRGGPRGLPSPRSFVWRTNALDSVRDKASFRVRMRCST